MPYGYSKRYRSRRTRSFRRTKRTGTSRTTRGYRRKGRYSKVSPRRQLWKNPLPLRGFYRFKFQDSGYSLTTAAVTFQSSMNFRLNSLYDPDPQIGGVQPYGFDQLCSANGIYNFYRVYASKITIYPRVQMNATTNWSLRVCVFPSKQGVTYTEFEDVCQIPGASYASFNSITNGKPKLKSYMSMKKLWGAPPIGSDFMAGYNANPSQISYWTVLADSSGMSTPAQVTGVFDVRITYYTELTRGDNVNES